MIPQVSAASAAAAGQQATLGGLDSQAFLELLVAQMKYQNPLAPTDSTAMMQQTAQFAQVESLQQIAKTQQQLLNMQMATAGGDLVGRHVTATKADGTAIEGTVDSVRYTANGPVLSVGDAQIGLTSVTSVSAVAPQQPPASS
ncbi:MAG TPA: flagellar hook capping FlgD N-terminal domain-containing protein [Euzebyales bacterium]|nr:flagellar hook capping FlgD N-terminal domain-containing protein [Euzebyales bacterium]